MELNIDYLHKISTEILKGKPHARRMGRSISLLYLLLARALYVDTPEGSKFVFIAHDRNKKYSTANEFYNMLVGEGIEIKEHDYNRNEPIIITKAGLTFYFINMEYYYSNDWFRGKTFCEIYCDNYVTKDRLMFDPVVRCEKIL